jgi:hypothetical protein
MEENGRKYLTEEWEDVREEEERRENKRRMK